MRIITLRCPECNTIVSANELESNRVMNCPGLDCQAILEFDDIPSEDREHFLNHKDRYQI